MDGTIPRRHLARVLIAIEQMEDEYGLRCANVFHAGDGNLHPLILFDSNKPEEVDRADKFGAAILELCVQVGGTVTGEHGVGMEKINQMCVQFSREELDAFMAASGKGIPLLFDAGHMAFAGGDVLRVIDKHHDRISHVHVKDVRMDVIDGLDRQKQSFLDAVALGAFTVPGDGSLDFGKIVQKFADYGYEGWFVVEAEQDPKKNPPLKMAEVGYKELMRVMTAAGYTVETQGFPTR